ncbi:unnamed protein product [Parascedosporium putredinis]|uniref:ribonuclease Z n=1 Tax=Parascedosporium putredinis TaxID=1442378 RepID=A0A9P1H8M6_9PEZI|nr:unnamed protein product [Parascedosporium putredinis]CAI8000892.1 unnamed protein product [Parascedosporium putredinis]
MINGCFHCDTLGHQSLELGLEWEGPICTLKYTKRRPPPSQKNRAPKFSPATPVNIHQRAYQVKPRTAFQFSKRAHTFPYFPQNTVFVVHPPRQSRTKETRRGYTSSGSESTMTSHVEIVTTPTADTAGATLYIHFDKRRYLVGRISEGTQRAFNQRKLAASSLEQIFVTGEVNWDTVGGLTGLLLTISDVVAGSREALAEQNRERKAKGRSELANDVMQRLDIHGAENLTYSLATARNFIFRTGMPFKPYELHEDRRLATSEASGPDWEDDCLRVWKIPLYKQSPSKRRRVAGDSRATSEDLPQAAQDRTMLSDLVESMFNSDWRFDALVPSKLHSIVRPAQAFIRDSNGSIQRYEGAFLGEQENVPDIDVLVREPWPATKVHTLPQTQPSAQVKPMDNKKLTSGQTVQGKDGPVTPDMVLEPPIKGAGFVVVDIPDAVYIDSFVSRPEWSDAELMDGVSVIYWILGKGLALAPEVQAFIKERPNLKHIMLSPDTCPDMIAFESHAGLTAKLQRIDPDRFPPLWYNNAIPNLGAAAASYLTGRTGKRSRRCPSCRLRTSASRSPVSTPEFQLWVAENERDIPNKDTEITPLGTGSALPSKYRNVSATLIRIPGYGSYLLDCGENTLGQLRRAYGYEETAQIMAELRCIFISHMHADHHLGTMSVIEAWQKATQGKSVLSICCTDYMRRFIEEYSQVQPVNFSNIRFYGDAHSDNDYTREFGPGDPSGLAKLERVRVNHCKSAHAGILTWSSGLKIAYSGDCRPSDRFAERAKGATLLVHEATFEDDKAGDAKAKKHSTMSEALGVAKKMEAKRVLLTHFSQRYAKLPAMEEKSASATEETQFPTEDRVVLNAFDQMRVKLGEFRKAEAFLPAIIKLLEEDSR